MKKVSTISDGFQAVSGDFLAVNKEKRLWIRGLE